MLHGNLTADPEVKPAQNGRNVVTFSLATSRDWKNQTGERVHQTDFHKVVAFGKLGDIVSTYLKKGYPVLLSGRLSNRSYVAKDGNKRYVTEVVMEDFNFLSRKEKDESKQKVLVSV